MTLKKIQVTLLFILLLFQGNIVPQGKNITDSVLKIFKTGNLQEITEALIKTPYQLTAANPRRIIVFADSALQHPANIADKDIYTKILITKAFALSTISEYAKAREVILEAIEIRKSYGLKNDQSIFYLAYAHNEAQLSELKIAAEYYQKGIKEAELEGNYESSAFGFTHSAILSYVIKDYNQAFENNKRALEIAQQHNLQYLLGDIYQHYVIMHIGLKDFKMAMQYAKMAEKLYLETGNRIGLGGVYDNIGLLFRHLNQVAKGVEYIKMSIEIKKELSDYKGLASSYNNLGSGLVELGQTDEGMQYLKISYDMVKTYNDKRQLSWTLRKLSDAAAQKGDYKLALEYYREYKTVYDSVFSEETVGKIVQLEAQYENSRKQREIEALKAIKEKDDLVRLYLIIAIIFVAGGAFAAYYAFRVKKKANHYLDDLNQQLVRKTTELEQLNEELKSLNRDKDKFFSVIAHDLRSPFFGLLGNTELLASEINNLSREKIAEFAQNTYLLTKNLYSLLENLLSWATVNTGRFKFTPEVFDLIPQVEHVISVVRSAASDKQIEIKFEHAGPVEVNTDKQVVNLIVRNLLTNAVKYTPFGGKILVKCTASQNSIGILVNDTGSGIPEETLENLFTNKVVSTRGTQNEKGTGLGLMLCKDMADMIGGEITASNVKGGGAQFVVTIPVS